MIGQSYFVRREKQSVICFFCPCGVTLPAQHAQVSLVALRCGCFSCVLMLNHGRFPPLARTPLPPRPMLLTLDIGNTRAKLVSFLDGRPRPEAVCAVAELPAALAQIGARCPSIEAVHWCSVGARGAVAGRTRRRGLPAQSSSPIQMGSADANFLPCWVESPWCCPPEPGHIKAKWAKIAHFGLPAFLVRPGEKLPSRTDR